MNADSPEDPKTRGKRRRVSRIGPEDVALWQKAMRGTIPLAPAQRDRSAEGGAALPAAATAKRRAAAGPSINGTRILKPTGPGEPATRIIPAPASAGQVGRPEPGLDRRNAERLRRGERAPEARIDLHGMTAARAHAALDRFMAQSLAERRRLVLVITGKGGKPRDPDAAPFMRPSEGVLRQQVPRWLRSGPFARRIVGIFQAHARHGGAGALYVYLKKDR